MTRAALAALLLVALPALAAPLRLLSWNLEWLADPAQLQAQGYWAACALDRAPAALPPCDAYRRQGIHGAADYAERKLAPLRRTLARLAADADVLALQEVQDPAAVQAVLPAGFHLACMTRKPFAQNLAFALRDRLPWTPACTELPELADDGMPFGLRPGLALRLHGRHGSLLLLNVHLKAGCARDPLPHDANPSCPLLQRQAAGLRRWANARAAEGAAFLVLGDWNRDLSRGPLLDGLVTVPVDRKAARRRACRRDVDQLAAPPALAGQLRQARLLPRDEGASDHCPLAADWAWR